MGDLPRICPFLSTFLNAERGVSEVFRVHDVVAVENAAGLVTRDAHCHKLGDASTYHVADSALPAKIETARQAIAIRLTDFEALRRNEQIALNDALRALRQLILETRPFEAEEVGHQEKGVA